MFKESGNSKAMQVHFYDRDPRDMRVSQYYSFGWTHPIPKNIALVKEFVGKRNSIQLQTIDQYALSQIDEMNDKFGILFDIK